MDRPVRRRAAVRQGQGRALQAGARGGDGREARPRSTRSPTTPRRRPSRTRSRRWSARAARSTASARIYGVFSSTMSTTGLPGGRARDGAEAGRLLATRSRRTRSSSRASPAVYETRETSEPHARAEAAGLARTTPTSCARAPSSTPRPRSGCRRSTSGWPRSTRASARTCSPTRRATSVILEKEADLAGLPESLRAGAAAAAESRGHKGKWAITNTRSSDGAVPHLLGPARPAREGLAQLTSAAATTATRTTTTRPSPRS